MQIFPVEMRKHLQTFKKFFSFSQVEMFSDRGMSDVNGYAIGRCYCLDEHCEVADIAFLIVVMTRYGCCFQFSFSVVSLYPV